MVKIKINFLLIFLMGLLGFQQSTAQLNAYMDTKLYKTPDGAYVDLMIEIYASSLTYRLNSDSVKKCSVEIVEVLRQNDSIIAFDKKILVNKEESSDVVYENLLEVKRFPLANQEVYELEVSLRDLYAEETEAKVVTKKIKPNFQTLNCQFSDIQLLEGYAPSTEDNLLTKSGYDLYPLLSDFFPSEFDKIAFYTELYNSEAYFGEDEKFALKYYIKNTKNNLIAGNLGKMKQAKTANVIPIIYAFDISKLPSGSYELVVEARNKQNELVAEQFIPFFRDNKKMMLDEQFLSSVSVENTFAAFLPADSLDEYIYCLSPITSPSASRMIRKRLESFTADDKRKFIYSFWYERDQENAQSAWEAYQKEVWVADKLFGTRVFRGYETDRGRIYLKYGKPNDVDARPNEPSSYPYIIWHYYKLGPWNNKTFIFYNPDLVTNNYEMLHSDVQGEIQNYRWQRILNSRNTPGGNLDDANEGNFQHYGSQSNVLFNNP